MEQQQLQMVEFGVTELQDIRTLVKRWKQVLAGLAGEGVPFQVWQFLADLRAQSLEVCEEPLIPGVAITCRLGASSRLRTPGFGWLEAVQEGLTRFPIAANNQGRVRYGPAFFVAHWPCNIPCQKDNLSDLLKKFSICFGYGRFWVLR